MNPERLDTLTAAAKAQEDCIAMTAAFRHGRLTEARAYGRWLAEEQLSWPQIAEAHTAVHDTKHPNSHGHWSAKLPWLVGRVPRRFREPYDGDAIEALIRGIMDVWGEVIERMRGASGAG